MCCKVTHFRAYTQFARAFARIFRKKVQKNLFFYEKTLVCQKKVVILRVKYVLNSKIKLLQMNKKILLVCGLILCSLTMLAAKIEGPKGAHPWKLSENANGVAPKFAHWTIGIDAGFNSFDGDFGWEMKHPIWLPSAGLSLEYNFTPMWTMGVQYNYDWYRVTGNSSSTSAANASVLLDGMMHRVQGYIGFDLMSACYPLAKRKIFGWDLFVGGGYGWFKNDIYYPDETRFNTAKFEAESNADYTGRVFLLAGTLFDFNLGRAVSLGLKATYSYFIKDDIDGRGIGPEETKNRDLPGQIKDLKLSLASKNNDGIIDVSLHLRFKLASIKKTHVKNIASYDAAYRFNGLADSGNRQKDTIVISHVDTLYISTTDTTDVVQQVNDNFVYVYFDHNSNTLNEAGLIAVQQLANQMKWDESLCVEIIGYADNTGSEEHNSNLGVARAQNIRDELVEEHNIDPSRITYSSGGTIHGGRSEGAYTPNRRADIRLMPCDEFGAIKQRDDDRNAQAVAAQAEAMKERDAKKMITAPEGMTLSAIARKFYGNTYCWVFIYQANKDTLKTPNYIPHGTRLVIPDLTDEQKHISKAKADAIYEKLK